MSLAPLETNREAVARCLINSFSANDGMRQRLRQGWADDGHGCNAQLLSFDTLNHFGNERTPRMSRIVFDNEHVNRPISQPPSLFSTLSVSKVWMTTGPGPAIINCAPGCWYALAESFNFQVTFMPIACWPYGTLNPINHSCD